MKPERFEALVGFTRNPAIRHLTPEIEWYRSKDETILGVINVDIFDRDFHVAVLGRDMDGRYRLIENDASIPNLPKARLRLDKIARGILATGKTVFPQDDEKGKRQDLFQTITGKSLHPHFSLLRDSRHHSSAKGLIAEIIHHFVDVDGNFIEQFQTDGFNSRMWELYLFAFLNEVGLYIERSGPAPDFIVNDGVHTAAIEAVTVNPTQNTDIENIDIEKLTPERIRELTKGYMPIKFGSPLFSKLKKRYWELANVKGLPLVFAIADFHEKQSMLWSSTALGNYLYGVHHDFYFDANGQMVVTAAKIDKHVYKGKEIPSGFFFQPDTEHVSAVLFSASGTISKFNRLGKIAGFGFEDVRMIRVGMKYRHDPNSALPDGFVLEVDEDYKESWGEGVSIFHNPNARIALPDELFPGVAHHWFENGQVTSRLPEFHTYASTTWLMTSSKHLKS